MSTPRDGNAATAPMHLKLLLPSRVFAEERNVLRIVAETREGSFGILPRRLDCVAALAPGILTYETTTDGEVFVAVDEGVLVKTGGDVLVSVRRAVRGSAGDEQLARLRDVVEREFEELDEHERSIRTALSKMESGFVSRFIALRRNTNS